MIRSYLVIALACALAACGKSGGGSGDSVAPTAVSPVGIWRGTVTDQTKVLPDGSGGVFDAIAMVDDQGHIRFNFKDGADPDVNARGVITTTSDDDSYTGYVDVYPTSVIPAGVKNPKPTISGNVTTETQLKGGLSLTGGVSRFDYDLAYDIQSTAGSDITRLAGTYTDAATASGVVTSLSFSNGTLTGSNTDNCSFSGTAENLVEGYNLYWLQVHASGCQSVTDNLNGDYAGMASILKLDDGIYYLVTNFSNYSSGRILSYKLQSQSCQSSC